MQPRANVVNVPVRQDVMPPNPRANDIQPTTVELVDHIPVREVNPGHQPADAQAPNYQAAAKPEDQELDRILTEVNQQVASTDMSRKKKKRFGRKKEQQPASTTSQNTTPTPSKPKKVYTVDIVAIMAAALLIALTVKIY